MGILVLLGLIVLVLVLLHQRGKRVAEQMGIDSETTTLDEAVRARYAQRRLAELLKASVSEAGDPRLGKAMADTFTEMTGMCPACKRLTWKEAETCDHCGQVLREPTSEAP